jgi:hypothetical protein
MHRRHHNAILLHQRDGWIPNSVRMNVAIRSPDACNCFGHRLRRQQLWVIVIKDGQVLGCAPINSMSIQPNPVLSALKVCLSGHLLVAVVAVLVIDVFAIGAVPVEVCKVERIVGERGSVASHRKHFFRAHRDDGGFDDGPAAIDAGYTPDGYGDRGACNGECPGNERIWPFSGRCARNRYGRFATENVGIWYRSYWPVEQTGCTPNYLAVIALLASRIGGVGYCGGRS